MIEAIKNMFRRKVRTLLTVFGISIGILALVVMGAMAEKITKLVSGGTDYYSDKVIVSGEGGFGGFGGLPLTFDKMEEIKKIEGVKAVSATISATVEKEQNAVNFGPPAMLSASDGVDLENDSFQVEVRNGRNISETDQGKAVLGSNSAIKYKVNVGDRITIRGQEYEVIGIYEKTLTTPDDSVVITMSDAQEIVYDDLPEIAKKQVRPEELATNINVYFKDGYSPNDMSTVLTEKIDGIRAIGPKEFEDIIASSVGTFTSILYGIALIALLIGSLSVINTMTMSISERTKEIGVKKAIGAKTRNIMSEYLIEAAIIGLLGGLIGLGLGSLIVFGANSVMVQSGDTIFLLTPRLVIGSVVFATVLGAFAGAWPAYHAARLSIVKSLREE
ncbi:ABC transporter permease [Patescibacteria group bacterium]|nr:ABC transporter permease [Patescibacteria group bacterium]